MDDKNRRDVVAPLIAVLLAGILAAYIVAYFQLGPLGIASPPGSPPAQGRVYRSQWQADLFTPGAIVESWVRGRPIYVGHR
jgi:hypothetical protein